MIENYYPKNLEEAKKGYDECLAKEKLFKEEHKDALINKMDAKDGEELHESSKYAKTRDLLNAIERECKEKLDIMRGFEKADNADKSKNDY